MILKDLETMITRAKRVYGITDDSLISLWMLSNPNKGYINLRDVEVVRNADKSIQRVVIHGE